MGLEYYLVYGLDTKNFPTGTSMEVWDNLGLQCHVLVIDEFLDLEQSVCYRDYVHIK